MEDQIMADQIMAHQSITDNNNSSIMQNLNSISKSIPRYYRKQFWEIYHSNGDEAAINFSKSISNKISSLPVAVKSRIFGNQIDDNTLSQFNWALRVPVAVQGALMPDAHLGYGLPIGGVLATKNAVIPYAVGVDIACRMRLTIFDVHPNILDDKRSRFQQVLLENSHFGAGPGWEKDTQQYQANMNHPLLDDPRWDMLPDKLKHLKDVAVGQLGTSGGGNHFIDWGQLTVDVARPELTLRAGRYVALMSHSGSRGVGAQIADYYSKLAKEIHPELDPDISNLAWLDMDQEEGQSYWNAMHLAGDFAKANHHLIHERMSKALGVPPIQSIQNHHNFCWLEEHLVDGESQKVYVHRKGATPAHKGIYGVIPGSMASPAYLVRGKGEAESLRSASHGAGRTMSRKKAKESLDVNDWKSLLNKSGVELVGGSIDESPQAYKDIESVIADQADLIEIVAKFNPVLVRMASDGFSED